MTPAEKTCPSCRVTRPASDFWRNRRERDGLQRYCKPCLSEFQRESAVRSSERALRWAAQAATLCLWFVGLSMISLAVQP